ncbi:MAG: ferritin-like domain-containing protein [Candidatus Omnitrophica bacterium]|nr:ferritin-like domain-containing protein [Candidatus Omnitrophota bacterium]
MKTDIQKNVDFETADEGLQELFVDQISDLYSAEQQLIKALPKMAKAANSPELRSAFEEHLELTEEHAHRLEKIFSDLHVKKARKKCTGMEGLVKEGSEVIKKEEEEGVIKDADLIAAAQRVEHYEIAGYGTVRTFAQMLGLEEAAELLQQTLDEEGEADKKLTAISESLLSSESSTSSEFDEDESEEEPSQN